MEVGKTYTRHDKGGRIVEFPFRKNVGKFTGRNENNGWLGFELSGGMVCSINGGGFKEAVVMVEDKK